MNIHQYAMYVLELTCSSTQGIPNLFDPDKLRFNYQPSALAKFVPFKIIRLALFEDMTHQSE